MGVDEPLVNGAVIDPSGRNSADLFFERHPRSRIRLINHFNPPDPAAAPGSIEALRRRGVPLFVTTQASNQAMPSLPQFSDGKALAISRLDPASQKGLLEGIFDALYILGGSFMPMIGNLSQLFHQRHPAAPILLTPWARSPQVVASAGPAAVRIRQVSPYPARRLDAKVNAFLQRFERRFGYTPYAMALGTHQALKLLEQALASGAASPAAVKRYLLSKPEHATSFGPVRFDANDDVQANYHVFDLADDQPPVPR